MRHGGIKKNMNNIKQSIAYLLCISFLIIICISAHADMILPVEPYNSDTSVDGYIDLETAYGFYQRFTTDNIVQIQTPYLYINTFDGDRIAWGITKTPGSSYILEGQMYQEDFSTPGWYQLEDVNGKTTANITTGDDYYFEVYHIGSSEIEVGIDTFAPFTDANYELHSKATVGGAWGVHTGSDTQLQFKLRGKQYNVSQPATSSYITTDDVKVEFYINHVANETTQYGFYIWNHTAYVGNYTTALWTTDEPMTFEYTQAGYTPGAYYYIKPHLNNSFGFLQGENITVLTKPTKPTNLEVTSVNGTNMTVEWTKGSARTANQTTVIVKSTYGYAQYDEDQIPYWGYPWTNYGVIEYNGTGTSTTITDLTPGQKYYLTAYTYINASGSPYYWWFSDDYAYTAETTAGGTYNITVKGECNGKYMNLSDGNYTLRAELIEGTVLNETTPTDTDGNTSITTEQHPDKFTLYFNETYYRSILTEPGQSNYTIFVPCNPVAAKITFIDYTTSFTVQKNARATLYRDNETTREYIHMDYIEADNAIRFIGDIGTTYRLGIACNDFNKTYIGDISLVYDTSFEVAVYGDAGQSVFYSQIQAVQRGWDNELLYFDFEDRSKEGDCGVTNSSVSVYYLSNDTLFDQAYQTVPWDFNYTTAVTNTTVQYYLVHEIRYVCEEDDENFTASQKYIYLAPDTEGTIIDDVGDIDDAFTGVLGVSPVHIDTKIVAWSSLIISFFLIFVLFTFSEKFAGFGIFVTAIVLAVFKEPLGLIASNVLNWGVIALIFILGIFVMIYQNKKEVVG